jgi:hypothetical protein
MRDLVRESRLSRDDLIQPYFVVESDPDFSKPIASMPGQFQLGLNQLVDEVGGAVDAGLKSLILFGIPVDKDPGRFPGLCRERHRAAGHPPHQGPLAGTHRGRRHLPVRVHLPRTLRSGHAGRRGPKRPDPGPSGPHGRGPGQGRRGHHRPLGHDGRPRGGHPPGPGRGRLC